MMIANDSTITTEFIPESNVMAQQYLFAELNADTSLQNNTLLNNFLNDNETQPIGYLFGVKKAMRTFFEYDSLLIDSIKIYQIQLRSLTDSIHYVDSLHFTNPLGGYFTQIENLTSQFNSIQSSISNIIIQHRENASELLDSASTINTLVEPNEIPETNEKVVNNIELILLNEGKVAVSSYLSQLTSIAEQCPYKGGTAVYRARSIIALFSNYISYDDQGICALEGIYRNNTTKLDENKPTVLVHPNPTNELVTIELQGVVKGLCNLVIKNELGQSLILRQFDCEEKIANINVKTLNPGVYSILVEINSEFISSEKLVIVR